MNNIIKAVCASLVTVAASAGAENWREVGTTVDLVRWEIDADSIRPRNARGVREAVVRMTGPNGQPARPLSTGPRRPTSKFRDVRRYVFDCREGTASLLTASADADGAAADSFNKPRNGSILQQAVWSACGRFSAFGQPPLQ